MAAAAAHEPDCQIVLVSPDQTYPDVNFELLQANEITIEGAISGSLPPEDVRISFSRELEGCGTDGPVEVAFEQVGPDENSEYRFRVQLPAADYEVTTFPAGLDVKYSIQNVSE